VTAMPRTRSRRISFISFGLLALAGCGEPLFSAEVVVDRFCVTQAACPSDQPPCLPPTLVAGTVTSPQLTIPVQLPPGLRTKGSTVILRLDDGRVTSTTSGVKLDGITSVDLQIQPSSGTAISAARYVRAPGAANVATLPLTGQGVNVADLLQSGNLQVVLSLAASGPPPATTWDAEIELCFYGKTVVSYF